MIASCSPFTLGYPRAASQENDGRRVYSLHLARKASPVGTFFLQLCRISWSIYDWIMMDLAGELYN
jgi:hypothetical protein